MIKKLKTIAWYKKMIVILACIAAIQGTYYFTSAEKREVSISKEQRGIYDRALVRAGTPKELLASLSDYQKKFILENLENGAVYHASNSDIAEPSSMMSDKMPDMRLTIISYSVEIDGEQQYQLFPSFQWLGSGYTIENDTFSFELDHDWAATSNWKTEENDSEEMTVYFTRSNGKQISIGTIAPYDIVNAGASGYVFSMPDGCNRKSDGYYGACAVYYAKKTVENPVPSIILRYTHTSNSLLNSSKKSYFAHLSIE